MELARKGDSYELLFNNEEIIANKYCVPYEITTNASSFITKDFRVPTIISNTLSTPYLNNVDKVLRITITSIGHIANIIEDGSMFFYTPIRLDINGVLLELTISISSVGLLSFSYQLVIINEDGEEVLSSLDGVYGVNVLLDGNPSVRDGDIFTISLSDTIDECEHTVTTQLLDLNGEVIDSTNSIFLSRIIDGSVYYFIDREQSFIRVHNPSLGTRIIYEDRNIEVYERDFEYRVFNKFDVKTTFVLNRIISGIRSSFTIELDAAESILLEEGQYIVGDNINFHVVSNRKGLIKGISEAILSTDDSFADAMLNLELYRGVFVSSAEQCIITTIERSFIDYYKDNLLKSLNSFIENRDCLHDDCAEIPQEISVLLLYLLMYLRDGQYANDEVLEDCYNFQDIKDILLSYNIDIHALRRLFANRLEDGYVFYSTFIPDKLEQIEDLVERQVLNRETCLLSTDSFNNPNVSVHSGGCDIDVEINDSIITESSSDSSEVRIQVYIPYSWSVFYRLIERETGAVVFDSTNPIQEIFIIRELDDMSGILLISNTLLRSGRYNYKLQLINM